MKIRLHDFYLLSIVVISMSCEKLVTDKDPLFSTQYLGEGKILFVSEAKNATSYEWDFGDGSPISNQENPTHFYSKNGDYIVKLRAKGGRNEVTNSLVVNIKDAPKPQTRFKYKLLGNGKVEFINETQNAERYSWDFGNGDKSTQQNITIQFKENGNYLVKLTASNFNGEITFQELIVINDIVKDDYIISFEGTILGKPVSYKTDKKECMEKIFQSECIWAGTQTISISKLNYNRDFSGILLEKDDKIFKLLQVSTKAIKIDTYNTFLNSNKIKIANTVFTDSSGFIVSYIDRITSPNYESKEYFTYNGDQTGSSIGLKSIRKIKYASNTFDAISVIFNIDCKLYDNKNTFVGKVEGVMQTIYYNNKVFK